MDAADPGAALDRGRFGGVGWEGAGLAAAAAIVGGTGFGSACFVGEEALGRVSICGWFPGSWDIVVSEMGINAGRMSLTDLFSQLPRKQ